MSGAKIYTVHAQWDAESETWWTDGEDLPGLTCQAETFDQLVEVILDLAPDLLHANLGIPTGQQVDITVVAERRAACTAACRRCCGGRDASSDGKAGEATKSGGRRSSGAASPCRATSTTHRSPTPS